MSYSIVSLFSGAGFLDFGFTENNFEIIWGAEIEKQFAYANNYNINIRYNKSDVIQNIDLSKVDVKVIPKSNGIIGGPPCQDFSKGNANNPGIEGERGKLVLDYLRIIEEKKPDFFLFENVEDLYKTKKHRENALMPLIEEFKKLGYITYFKILNSIEYGIPQDRSRVFIVAFKTEIIKTLENNGLKGFEWPKPMYEDAIKKFNWPVEWEFGTKIDEKAYIENLEYPYKLTVHSVLSNVDNLKNNVSFNPKSEKFKTVREGDTKKKSFKRLHRFRYSPTVAYGNNEVHLHPTEPRRLTVREALRIQSVPDWYEFPEGSTLTDMFKMISNGVSYEVAYLLSKQVKLVLDNYYEKKDM
ncbi:DNA cytosine methyltransferase [Clostridium perfringens]|uniref:DNA cytosine methyltransferase n=1 Tax=Clostridium perfringens TaxID=1502 RepID=UPI001CCA6596|nr:DNA cytosine methyltransferase [Clostridium perfringens]UBK86160.1 DNA cytosine methyltransferase [Clostridium perfringens]